MARTQLVLYTVALSYFATGEGHTLSLWIGFARDPQDAREKFQQAVPNGSFWVQGAQVFEGFNREHVACKYLLTPLALRNLEDPHCMREFSAQLHFNYS